VRDDDDDDDDDDCPSPSLLMSRLLSSVGVMVRGSLLQFVCGEMEEEANPTELTQTTDRRHFCSAKLPSSTPRIAG